MGGWSNSLLIVQTADPTGRSVSDHSADALPLLNRKPANHVHASGISMFVIRSNQANWWPVWVLAGASPSLPTGSPGPLACLATKEYLTCRGKRLRF